MAKNKIRAGRQIVMEFKKFILHIELPIPTSDNEHFAPAGRFGGGRRRFRLSDKYRAYKKEAAGIYLEARARAKIQILRPTIDAPIRAVIDYKVPDLRRDMSNTFKVLLDAGKGVLFDDDRWIMVCMRSITLARGEAGKVFIHFFNRGQCNGSPDTLDNRNIEADTVLPAGIARKNDTRSDRQYLQRIIADRKTKKYL
jgi:Holliday junction resolvase RusA-like endonuclease